MLQKLFKNHKTLIMGILNVTPDSFSDGGVFFNFDKSVEHARKMISDGADIIDIGGESARPNSIPIDEKLELERILPVLKIIRKEYSEVIISVDTYKSGVAHAVLSEGADIINDITAGRDELMFQTVAKFNAGIALMHMRGIPQTMQNNTHYDSIIEEIKNFLKTKADAANSAGISKIIIDPGIGFGKDVDGNVKILKNLAQFKQPGCPLLIGCSRKTFLGKITGIETPAHRLIPSLAALIPVFELDNTIVRVHDVLETYLFRKIFEKIFN